MIWTLRAASSIDLDSICCVGIEEEHEGVGRIVVDVERGGEREIEEGEDTGDT